ncbi:MAG TPA: aldo/keto reductase [Bacteroidales bacterium]|nr:aldo/keto reductase [Bacteroidales bacterium]
MNKREFLKLSSVAIAGSMIPSLSKAGSKSSGLHSDQPILRTLGKTGLKVPVVSSGGVHVDNPNLVREVFQSGIIHFDSAPGYQNGRVDMTLGEMFTEFGRGKFISATKVGFPVDKETGQYQSEATTQAFLDQLDESLQRQKSEYVDILYLQSPPGKAAAMNEEMLNGLRLAKEKGKARFVGIATHSNQAELIETGIESNFYEILLLSYNFRLEDTLKSSIARAAESGIGIVAMKTLAGKFLDKEKTIPINKSAALKWVLQDENVHTAIMSIRSIDDLELYKSIMYDIRMKPEEEHDISTYKQTAGLFCHGCEECKLQCPNRLPIPDIMRAYMYAYGYSETRKAYDVLASLSIDGNPCKKCPVCSISCRNGLDVAARIKDVLRIREIPADFLT